MTFHRALTRDLRGACFASVLVAAVSASLAAHVHAQTPEGVDLDTAARALFEDGRRAFEGGDFETALSRFQQAYDISHRVPLLWNIATTLDRLRRDEDALAMFQQYLEAAPEATNRSEVEGRIRLLREAVDRRHAEETARAEEARRLEEERQRLEAERAAGGGGTTPTEPASGGGGITPIVFIVGAGLTAAAAGVLIWSGVDTLTANDNYVLYTNSTGADLTMAEGYYQSALDAQLRTNVLVGITGGLAAATLVLVFFTDWDGDPPPASDGEDDAAPAASPAVTLLPTFDIGVDGGSLGLRGSF